MCYNKEETHGNSDASLFFCMTGWRPAMITPAATCVFPHCK